MSDAAGSDAESEVDSNGEGDELGSVSGDGRKRRTSSNDSKKGFKFMASMKRRASSMRRSLSKGSKRSSVGESDSGSVKFSSPLAVQREPLKGDGGASYERSRSDAELDKSHMTASPSLEDEATKPHFSTDDLAERTSNNADLLSTGGGGDGGGTELELVIRILEARDLIAADQGGTSDPYVKVRVNKSRFKTKVIKKNLSPRWDETFTAIIGDAASEKIELEVFDKDVVGSDDPLGTVSLSLAAVRPGGDTLDEWYPLVGVESGAVRVALSLQHVAAGLAAAAAAGGKKGKLSKLQRSASGRVFDNSKKTGMLTVLLVEGDYQLGSLRPVKTYVRLRVGKHKYKSKSRVASSTPQYKESFDMKVSDILNQNLELVVCAGNLSSKDDEIGQVVVRFTDLPPDTTHDRWLDLQPLGGGGGGKGSGNGGAGGRLHVMMTLSTQASDFGRDDGEGGGEDEVEEAPRGALGRFKSSFKDMKRVGSVTVTVERCTGVRAADVGGTSDPFVVLEMGNTVRRTETIYKTLNPEWNKTFKLEVLDVHQVLEFKVFDEDKGGAPDFLGVIHLPLLKIRHGESRQYALKNKTLTGRTKGTITLRAELSYNVIKACVRTINPKPVKYIADTEKFKIKTFKRNVARLEVVISAIAAFGGSINDLFQWKVPRHSASAFAFWIFTCLFFQLWWVPFGLVLLTLRCRLNRPADPDYWDERTEEQEGEGDAGSDDDDADDAEDADGGGGGDDGGAKNKKPKSEKTGLREKLNAVERICTKIQNALDTVAAYLERIGLLFKWEVPFCSRFLVFLLLAATVITYIIPLRILLLLWGTNKFTKKFRVPPNYRSNNEVIDLLDRIPSKVERVRRAELDPSLGSKAKKKKDKKA